VADGWCWFVLREKYCWLVAAGWFVLRENYCWLVVDKPSEQGVIGSLSSKQILTESLDFFFVNTKSSEKRKQTGPNPRPSVNPNHSSQS
jgi:hypothetical protein